MKKILLLAVFSIVISCSNTQEVKLAEVSCGQCQFALDSQNGCDLAVRVDGKAYFLDGFNIDSFGDAHDKYLGFCKVIRKAEVSGVVKNGRFKASSVKLLDHLE
jgi:hypothetical protein